MQDDATRTSTDVRTMGTLAQEGGKQPNHEKKEI